MFPLIKFFHLLCVLSLSVSVVFCLALASQKKYDMIFRINKTMLVMMPFAMLTGALLVFPSHFTFHTPWIRAAFLLASSFIFAIVLLLFLQKKKNHLGLQMIYLFLAVILILTIHDAVTRSTFLLAAPPLV